MAKKSDSVFQKKLNDGKIHKRLGEYLGNPPVYRRTRGIV